jgi:hypothetical protein
MPTIDHYELCKDGTILEDGTEIFSECVKSFKTKKELIAYAKKKKLNPDEYFIDTIGFEYIQGVKVPCNINDFPEYLNSIKDN